MERPRSFPTEPIANSSVPSYMTQVPELGAGRSSLLNTPFAFSVIAFIVAYIGLGVSPSSWPLERYYSIIDSNGELDKKKRAFASAAIASVAYYGKHYIG